MGSSRVYLVGYSSKEHPMRIARNAAALTAAFFSCALFLSPAIAQSASAPAPAAASAPKQTVVLSADAQKAALAAYSGASADCQAALLKALSLSANGQWKSAYDELASFDPKNADPYALAMRVRLCLDGFVRSEMHRAFALKDLAEGETLDALRRGQGDYDTFEFDPEAAAQAEAQAGTASPGILDKTLGDYFYDVYVRFAEQWVEPENTIIASGLAHYAGAEKAGLKDATALRKHAELLFKSGDADSAEALYRASLLLDPKDPAAHCGLAEVLAGQKKGAEALVEVDAAIATSGSDLENRFNAYVLGARTGRENGDAARSIAYLDKADADFPEEPAPGLVRVLLAVQNGSAEEGSAAADKVYARFPNSPYVVRSLLSIWLQGTDMKAPENFLDRGIAAQAANPENLAVLQFYKALFLAQTKGEASHPDALALLDQAEANFKKVYKDDNEVFGVIAQIRQELTAPSDNASAPTDIEEPAAAPATSDDSSAVIAPGANQQDAPAATTTDNK
jgi:hypothetical protein